MITAGVLLIEGDALRPRCFEVEAGLHPNAWMPVKQTLTPQQLEKELSATGWTLFFMAGRIRATAFGFNRDNTIYAALKRGIQAMRQQRCNCLQIETVEMIRFYGFRTSACQSARLTSRKDQCLAGPSFGDSADISGTELRKVVAT